MTQPNKPSAGALRAAKMIEGNFSTAPEPEDVLMSAQIIDRETGVAELSELLEAVKAVMAQLDISGQIDYLGASTYKRLEQAIAKCEGSE